MNPILTGCEQRTTNTNDDCIRSVCVKKRVKETGNKIGLLGSRFELDYYYSTPLLP